MKSVPLTAAQLAHGLLRLDHARQHIWNADPGKDGSDPATFDSFMVIGAVSDVVRAEQAVAEERGSLGRRANPIQVVSWRDEDGVLRAFDEEDR